MLCLFGGSELRCIKILPPSSSASSSVKGKFSHDNGENGVIIPWRRRRRKEEKRTRFKLQRMKFLVI